MSLILLVILNCGAKNRLVFEEKCDEGEIDLPTVDKPISPEEDVKLVKHKAFTSLTYSQNVQEMNDACTRSNGCWNSLLHSCFCPEDHLFHAQQGCLSIDAWKVQNPNLLDCHIPESDLALALQGISFENMNISSSVYFSDDIDDKIGEMKINSVFVMDAYPLMIRKHVIDRNRSGKMIQTSFEFEKACLEGANHTHLFSSDDDWIHQACAQSASFWSKILQDDSSHSEQFLSTSVAAGENCDPWCMSVISPDLNSDKMFAVVAGWGKNYLHRTIVYRTGSMERKELRTVLHANGQIFGWIFKRSELIDMRGRMKNYRSIWFLENPSDVHSGYWINNDVVQNISRFTIDQCKDLMKFPTRGLNVFVFEHGVRNASLEMDNVHFMRDAQSCLQGYLEPSTFEEDYDRYLWSHGQMVVDILQKHVKGIEIWIANKIHYNEDDLYSYLKTLDEVFDATNIQAVVISFQRYPNSNRDQKIFYEWMQRNQDIIFVVGATNSAGKNPEGLIPSSLQGLLPNLLVVAAYDETTGQLRTDSSRGKNHADIAAIDTCADQGPEIRHCATSGAAPRAAAAALELMRIFPHCGIQSIIHALRNTCKQENIDVLCGGPINPMAAQELLSTTPCANGSLE